MSAESKRTPKTGLWIGIGLPAILGLYVVSFGPANWLRTEVSVKSVHLQTCIDTVDVMYRPLDFCCACGPEPIAESLAWWAESWEE